MPYCFGKGCIFKRGVQGHVEIDKGKIVDKPVSEFVVLKPRSLIRPVRQTLSQKSSFQFTSNAQRGSGKVRGGLKFFVFIMISPRLYG